MRKKIRLLMLFFVMTLCMMMPAQKDVSHLLPVSAQAGTLTSVPKYSGQAYAVINNNQPSFTAAQKQNTAAFETYSSLDSLGRCGAAFANICAEIEPTEARGDISSVHPSGWRSGMGWERCHLIGYQLSGENANERNLITGTHYFNVTGMLPFENMVDDYVDETGNHVLYRVTPVFEGTNLIASGVQMEAYSVEDEGDGICFNVYVFNVQPGKNINYRTGLVTDGTVEALETSTISLTSKKATYSGKAISIGTAKVTGSTGKVTYTYYTNSSCTSRTTKANGASSTGKAPKNAGTYYVKAQVAADTDYKSATSKAVRLVITKKTQYITVKVTGKSYKDSAVKTSARSFSLGLSAPSGKYKVSRISGSSCLSVSSAGKVTVKKGTNAGTYKIRLKISSPATTNYKSKSFTKTITVKIKQTASAKVTKSTSKTTKSTSGSAGSTSSGSGSVYWTPGGSCYHKTKNCPSLSRSKVINSGTISESGKSKACSICY